MSTPFFSVGHSNRSLADFAGLLQAAGVTRVLDIRKIRRSRANPQFNGDVLAESLAPWQIGYEALPPLGGLRGKTRGVAADVNAYWTNDSFHRYADYALGTEFDAGLAEALALGRREPCALMCAEALWWRCHRRIVADYLLARGERVLHIMGAGRLDTATMTPAGHLQADGRIVYPAPPLA